MIRLFPIQNTPPNFCVRNLSLSLALARVQKQIPQRQSESILHHSFPYQNPNKREALLAKLNKSNEANPFSIDPKEKLVKQLQSARKLANDEKSEVLQRLMNNFLNYIEKNIQSEQKISLLLEHEIRELFYDLEATIIEHGCAISTTRNFQDTFNMWLQFMYLKKFVFYSNFLIVRL